MGDGNQAGLEGKAMSVAAAQQQTTSQTPPPGATPTMEDKQWADLAQEMEDEQKGGDGGTEHVDDRGEGGDKGQQQRQAKETKEPDKPKATYEELEGNYRNIQTALRQEREARQREQQARQQSDERLTGITQLIENLRAGRGQQTQEQPKQPTVEEDPIGFFQAELAKRDEVIAELQSGTKQTSEQMEAARQEQAFWGTVERSEVEIRKTTPDYDDACRHLEEGRMAELQVILPDDSPQAQAYAAQFKLTPAQLRAHMLNQDRISVAQQALQLGMSPAQLYYGLAKQRGFKAAAKPNGKGNGAAAAEAAKTAAAAAQRGQRASQSIGGSGGGAAQVVSLTDLVDLYSEDPAAFDKEWERAAREGRLG